MAKLILRGRHRLLVGDATKPESYLRLMAGEPADLVFTDPPYNVAYQTKLSVEEAVARHRRADGKEIMNDDMSDEDFYKFLTAFYKAALAVSKPGAAIYVCHADIQTVNFRSALVDAGWTLRQNLIWVKQIFVMGRQDYHWRHEPILYGWKPGAAHFFVDDRTQDTVFEADVDLKKMSKAELITLCKQLRETTPTTVAHENRPHRSDLHPTMKPIALVTRYIRNSSREDEIVLDSFGGSGTTLVAAHRTRRRARLIEQDTRYADVILRRATAEGLVCHKVQ